MRRTPVYIVCSPRPGVGKTLTARLLTEFLLLQDGSITAFDINLREPSLLDYLPELTETATIADTHGQMALMDQLILNDGVPKVIDLGFHAFDDFFKMIGQIGFIKEAGRRGVVPAILFLPDATRASVMAWRMLVSNFPDARLIVIDNEHILNGELPREYQKATLLKIAALPAFLRSIIGRTNLSFTNYLRTNQDSSSELHQWIRRNYIKLRDMNDGVNAPPSKRSPLR